MIKIVEVKVSIPCDEAAIKKGIASFLGCDQKQIKNYKLLKRSIDARNKQDICYKCNFAVEIDPNLIKNAVFEQYEEEKRLEIKNANRSVVVVGSGPSGLFCALTLAKAGANVVLLERGEKMEKRIKSVENYLKNGKFNKRGNIQEGEGGAGTFSDGKLNTGIKSPLTREVLHLFHDYGADKDVLIDSKPHVGTDVIRNVVVSMRKAIEKLGGKFFFETTFQDFEYVDGKIEVKCDNKKQPTFLCDDLVLALGYSARDTHRSLYSKGLNYKQKPFSVGYRIEHLQKDIDFAQYGKVANLPPADYKLFTHLPDGRGVYTFCMCPGGEVVPANNEERQIVTNGMSYHSRKGKNANSAILVSVDSKDYPSSDALAGMEFQQRLETEAFQKGDGNYVVTNVEDFLHGRPSFELKKVQPTIRPKYVLGDVGTLLPKELAADIREAIKIFAKKIAGFDEGILTGIETRSSAPFMVLRDENLQTNFENVYMIGEGAGMAGGIVSSAVDGIKIALKIIEKGKDGNN